jgi:Family of unknown function (DUF5906)
MARKPFSAKICTPTPAGNLPAEITVDDFRAYMPTPHGYIFMPCQQMWPAASIDARLPPIPVLNKLGKPKLRKGKPVTIRPSKWLDKNRPVEQMTWMPGEPTLIADRLFVAGACIERPGVTSFNLYRPPQVKPGNANDAEQWLSHIRKIYPDDADHIIAWLAHRVQRPGEKINHALVLGGEPGIGKDSMLEPVKYAVGPWNFHDISPTHLLGRFNNFAKAIILRVNEGRDLGEIDRFKFYDRTKIYCASPPDVLRVDEKHLPEHYVPNVLGFIITTNHKTDGIYLPANDRRHYVAWSDCKKEEFTKDCWIELWRWYDQGGRENVAAYLSQFDLSKFDPKAPPLQTPAFQNIINASRAPEDAELADVLDELGNPDAVTIAELMTKATGEIAEWLLDRRNRRALPHRLERCGYTSVENPQAKDGLWKMKGGRQVIYAKSELTAQKREEAARQLQQATRP